MNKDIEKGIKKLVIFFSICFFSIIGYLTYFNIFTADKIVTDSTNQRLAIYDNEYIRGSILDRNGKPIVTSKRNEKGTQDRIYTNGEMYAHVIGYNSYKYGKTGVELQYNDILQGRNFMYNVFGSMTKNIGDVITKKEKRGNDVCLTIDKVAQERAYKAMGTDRGGVVAINPKTGEIIAMVSTPSFNPQNINEDFDSLKNDEGKPFINRAAQGYYPPGSVFKLVTSASFIENESQSLDKTFNCNGRLKIGNYTLTDQNNVSHGKINLKNAFKYSCNYTFGSIGMELGYDKLKDTAEKFMFNKDIPLNQDYDTINIRNGSISIGDKNDKAELAQNAIGQNKVAANPMAMALVTSAIANNGVMMKPYIVKEVKNPYGFKINEAKPEKLADSISKETSDKIKEYMVETVKSGTGTNARIQGITVAGKTGSAEDSSNKQSHSWFVAFAPAEDPQIAVAVIVENAGYGGRRAAEVARETIKAYLNK